MINIVANTRLSSRQYLHILSHPSTVKRVVNNSRIRTEDGLWPYPTRTLSIRVVWCWLAKTPPMSSGHSPIVGIRQTRRPLIALARNREVPIERAVVFDLQQLLVASAELQEVFESNPCAGALRFRAAVMVRLVERPAVQPVRIFALVRCACDDPGTKEHIENLVFEKLTEPHESSAVHFTHLILVQQCFMLDARINCAHFSILCLGTLFTRLVINWVTKSIYIIPLMHHQVNICPY